MPSRFDTPILFVLFNRPDTTQVVFNQIKKIKPERLFVAADGPREWVAGEKERCEETRRIVEKVDWDCEVKTLFRTENAGCARAVSAAITWFFNQVPEGIVLEDDCLPDVSFFWYCRELLQKYRTVDHIKLIGGNNYQNGLRRGPGSYYFSRYAETWGWASWRRAWEHFDFEMDGLEETLAAPTLVNAFASPRERRYWYRKFRQTKKGGMNAWDYQFTYAILKAGGIAISPQVNLVQNIGLYNHPTHVSLRDSRKSVQPQCLHFPLVHPPMVVDRAADHFTYAQIYSRSPRRLWRLIKENGTKNCLLYGLQKLTGLNPFRKRSK